MRVRMLISAAGEKVLMAAALGQKFSNLAQAQKPSTAVLTATGPDLLN